jgi:hypothetical protein
MVNPDAFRFERFPDCKVVEQLEGCNDQVKLDTFPPEHPDAFIIICKLKLVAAAVKV